MDIYQFGYRDAEEEEEDGDDDEDEEEEKQKKSNNKAEPTPKIKGETEAMRKQRELIEK